MIAFRMTGMHLGQARTSCQTNKTLLLVNCSCCTGLAPILPNHARRAARHRERMILIRGCHLTKPVSSVAPGLGTMIITSAAPASLPTPAVRTNDVA